MKTWATACLASALLLGCSSHSEQWESSNVAEIANVGIALSSDLWINHMPVIGDQATTVLHGALHLNSNLALPEGLNAQAVIIQQGDQRWEIDAKQIDVRAYSENQWDVIFAAPINIDERADAEVSLQLSIDGETQWFHEKHVGIDAVY